ncbi:cytochrome P450 [Angustibacter aerolatus]
MTGLSSIPLVRGSAPVLGHAVQLLRDPLGFVVRAARSGPLARIRIGPREAVLVCDHELVHAMLVNDRVFDKGGPLYDRARESMGNGLVTCPHEGHRKRRRAVQPAFTAERVAVYSRGVAEVLARGTSRWQHGQELDVTAELMTMSNAVTVRSVLGGEIAPEAAEHVVEDFDVLVPGMFRRMLMPAALSRLPLQRRYDAAGVRARRTVTEIIAARHDSTTDFGDLLSALEATDGPSGPRTSTDAEMVDDVFSFFLAGTETVASAVAWTMLLIAQHPEIEARLHEEIDRVLDGEQVTYEHLDALGLADAVVTEALRLYPPVWLLTREVTEDAELGGQHLPAGTTIAFSPYLLHRDPSVFDRPDVFDPDRWEDTKPPRGSFVPFGEGARKCVGERFAMSLAVLTVVDIASRWRLTVADERSVRPAAKASLAPRGLRMRLSDRTLECAPVVTG